MIAPTSPIFIGGLAHSGKTPLRMVLDAHPDLSMTRRTYLWERFYGRFGDLRNPAALRRCLSAMSRDPGARVLKPDMDRVRREFAEGPASYARLFGLLHEHAAERKGKRRWGDQLGFIERFADPIFDEFPAARMIHMIRDPRDRAGVVFAGRRPRPGQLGWETARWRRSAMLAERNHERYRGRYRVVTYESFVSEPSETMTAICEFVGEAFLPSMQGALTAVQFDAEATSSQQADFIERQARRELPRFGYAPVRARRADSGGVHRPWPIERAAMVAWRLLEDRHGARMRARVGS